MKEVKNRNINKLVLAFLFLPFLALSQKSYYEIKNEMYFNLKSVNNSQNDKYLNSIMHPPLVPSYNMHLGSFCKMENNISKNNSMPILLRLGTVQYVNQLENKYPSYQLRKFEDQY